MNAILSALSAKDFDLAAKEIVALRQSDTRNRQLLIDQLRAQLDDKQLSIAIEVIDQVWRLCGCSVATVAQGLETVFAATGDHMFAAKLWLLFYIDFFKWPSQESDLDVIYVIWQNDAKNFHSYLRPLPPAAVARLSTAVGTLLKRLAKPAQRARVELELTGHQSDVKWIVTFADSDIGPLHGLSTDEHWAIEDSIHCCKHTVGVSPDVSIEHVWK